MIVLQVNDVARYFDGEPLYEQVSFNIQTHDRIALVGRNGAGKSTLINQIIGKEPLSAGTITQARDISIGYLEQHVAVDSPLTIWDEMMTVFSDTLALRDQADRAAQRVADLAEQPESDAFQEALREYDRIQEGLTQQNAYAIESDVRTVLHGFGFYEADYDTPVQSLSGGQKTRLALARILLMDHDLLILDEPTNHLDMETLAWLETYLSNYRGALLIVSHDRYFLNKVANQVVEIRNHTAYTYKGNYDYYLEEKARRLEQEWTAYEKQQDQIQALEDFVQRNIARASTTKRAQSRRKQLEKMQRIDKPLQDAKSPRMTFRAERPSGDRVLEAQDLAIGYPDHDTIASGINFDLRRQEAIAVVGPNGIGKSTLLKTLINQIPAKDGVVIRGTNVSIGYYDQNVNQLDPELTVLETLWRAQDTTDEWQVRSILGSFLFSGDAVEKKVALLSGGEKARLSLALLATNHDNTLLLDEPTNHLDIDSKEVLEEALIEFDGTIFFVSHDRYFINRVATKVLEIAPDGSSLYLGDYDYYQAKKAEQMEIEALRGGTEPEHSNVSEQKSQQKRSYQEQRELEKEKRQLVRAVDQAIADNEALDALITQLEAEMLEANEQNDTQLLADKHTAYQQAQEDQLAALEEWEAVSLALEAFYEAYPELES